MHFIDRALEGRYNIFSYFLGIVFIVVGFLTAQSLMVSFLPFFFDDVEYTSLRSQNDYMLLLGKNGFFAFSLMPFLFLFLCLVYTVRFIHKRKIISVFTGRLKFDWRRFLISFLIMFSILVLLLFVQYSSEETLFYNFKAEKFFTLLIIAIVLVPIQIVAEEILFRSYVMQGLKRRVLHNGHSVVISGIMFGMLHLGNPEIKEIGFHLVFYYIMAGVFLGAIVLFDNGLELSLGYHAANNLFGALIVSSDWQAFQTHALFIDTSKPGNGLGSIVFSLVLYVFLFFLFYKIFNWRGLKEIWSQ